MNEMNQHSTGPACVNYAVTQVKSQWKRINSKQIARWQHLSQLKASAFLFEIF
jgi:hypothetical protein